MAFSSLFNDFGRLATTIERAGALRAFDLLDQVNDLHSDMLQSPSYPPSNVIQLGQDAWRIELAVAGFSREQLQIQKDGQRLTIEGKLKEEPEVTDKKGFPLYIKRGIAERQFKLSFSLPDYVEVTDATFENGLLSLDIVRELPETQKPKLIELRDAKSRDSKPLLTTTKK